MLKHSYGLIYAISTVVVLLGGSLFSLNAVAAGSVDQPIIVAATKAQCKAQAKACVRKCKKRFKTQGQRMSCGSGCRSKRKACESKASG